jgi:hypothetical protein
VKRPIKDKSIIYIECRAISVVRWQATTTLCLVMFNEIIITHFDTPYTKFPRYFGLYSKSYISFFVI